MTQQHKTKAFWLQVQQEIEGRYDIYFFLCEHSETFEVAFEGDGRRYFFDKAKEFLKKNPNWFKLFNSETELSILFNPRERQTDNILDTDRCKIRNEFVNWMVETTPDE